MELYLHIPFCKQKCAYCAFKSVPSPTDGAVFDYLTALNKEVKLAGEQYRNAIIDTIYIGGGTPTYLSTNRLTALIDNIYNSFNISPSVEFTVEGNPESITEDKLTALKARGVNRISIGVQSLYDDNLTAISRIHNEESAISALKLSRKYFDNVSGDLILGLPYDTDERVENEIIRLAEYVSHISIYLLSIEEDTPLYNSVSNNKIFLPDSDKQIDFIHCAAKRLASLGFDRYEYSNFAKDGNYSRHNFGYWNREEYLGLGLNSSSLVRTLDGKTPLQNQMRYKNTPNLDCYLQSATAANKYPFCSEDIEYLTERDILEEKVMLGLRTFKGVDKSLLFDKKDLIEGELSPFFRTEGNSYCLTAQGMDVMNFILSEIL